MIQRNWALAIYISLLLALAGCNSINSSSPKKTTGETQAVVSPPIALSPTTAWATYSPLKTTLSQGPQHTAVGSTLLQPTRTSNLTVEPSNPGPAQPEDSIPTCPGDGIPVSPPEHFGFSGVIVYESSDPKGLFVIGGKPLTYSQLPVPETEEFDVLGFSTDGSWLAYSLKQSFGSVDTLSNPTLFLLSFQGEKREVEIDMSIHRTKIPKGSAQIFWGTSSGAWLNEEYIEIFIGYIPSDGAKPQGFSAILEPLKGIWHEELFSGLTSRKTAQGVGFSPDLTRALYTTTEDTFVLLDLISQMEVWKDTTTYVTWGIGPKIRWAPDSSTAAYEGLDTPIYFISRDGNEWKEIRGLLFSDLSYGSYIQGFRWSQDSRYLAIIIGQYNQFADKTISILYIYDVKGDKYIFRCPFQGYEDVYDIYWSPDGRYIIPHWPGNPSYPLILFDWQTGMVIELAERAKAVGWSDKFPAKWP